MWTADTWTNGIHTHPPGPPVHPPAQLRPAQLRAARCHAPGRRPGRRPHGVVALAAGDGTVAPALVPALAPPATVVDRIAGSDRFATAVAASVSTFPATASASAVVLASGDSYPDALVGVTLTASLNAPLLLTSGTTLPSATKNEIVRVLPAGGTVYLLGGTASVPSSIAAQLATEGLPHDSLRRS